MFRLTTINTQDRYDEEAAVHCGTFLYEEDARKAYLEAFIALAHDKRYVISLVQEGAVSVRRPERRKHSRA